MEDNTMLRVIGLCGVALILILTLWCLRCRTKTGMKVRRTGTYIGYPLIGGSEVITLVEGDRFPPCRGQAVVWEHVSRDTPGPGQR